jgi:hypothetical protein
VSRPRPSQPSPYPSDPADPLALPPHLNRQLPDPLTRPLPVPDHLATLPTPRELHRLAVSAIGHGGNHGNHADPAVLLREAAELLRFEGVPSNDVAVLRRQTAELRAATAQALALEAAAAELLDAEYDAGVVRRRLERAERSYRRRADLDARRAAGGLYVGERRSPNRPTHVEVDDLAWSALKVHAARRGRGVGAVVGDLVARAADAGVPAERDSERRSERRTSDGRRAARYARLFLPDDDTWFRFRAQAVAVSVSIARAVGLVVEQEARRLGWRPGTER